MDESYQRSTIEHVFICKMQPYYDDYDDNDNLDDEDINISIVIS